MNASTCVVFDRATRTAGWDDRCTLCAECRIVAARDIWALKLDYRDLEQWLPRGGGAGGQRVAGTVDPPTPLRLTVDELQRDIAWTLGVWEPVVRELAGLAPERTIGVRQGWAVSTAVDVIAPRVRLLANVPLTWGYADGLDAGLVERDGLHAIASLRLLHRRARAMLGLSRLVVRLPGECSGCGAVALEREGGSDSVICGHCRRRWSEDEYRRYVGLLVAEMAPAPP